MNIIKSIATQGPTGYVRGGGTLASIQAALLIWFFAPHDTIIYSSVVILFAIISFIIIRLSGSFFAKKDPREIVLDESVGCMIASFGLVSSVYSMISAFLLFRLLDIIKPGIISSAERLPGAWGVIGDDCVAGIITNIVMHSTLYLVSL